MTLSTVTHHDQSINFSSTLCSISLLEVGVPSLPVCQGYMHLGYRQSIVAQIRSPKDLVSTRDSLAVRRRSQLILI